MLYHLRSVCQCFSHPTAFGRHVWSLPSSDNAVSPQIRESMLQSSNCMWKACLVLVVSATPYPLQIMLCRLRSVSECFEQSSHCMWKACLVLVVSATPYPLQIMLCRFRSLSQCFSYPNAFGRHMFGPRCCFGNSIHVGRERSVLRLI